MSYAGTAELARVLRLGLNTPVTGAQGTAMERALDTAAMEIDLYCFGGSVDGGTVIPGGSFATPYPAAVVGVNVKRAVEHWREYEMQFGLIGIGDSIPVFTARDSFDRHAHALALLRTSWGLA